MSLFVYPWPDLFVSICVTATDANLVMDHSHTLEWGFKIPLASYTISCAFVCSVLKRDNL